MSDEYLDGYPGKEIGMVGEKNLGGYESKNGLWRGVRVRNFLEGSAGVFFLLRSSVRGFKYRDSNVKANFCQFSGSKQMGSIRCRC